MTVSVVIPVWNRRDLLVRLLETLRAQTCPPGEVIAVDNASEDGAPEAAEQGGARVIRLARNTGFAHAVNTGIRAARGEWIAVINTDVELATDWLARLLEAERGEWFLCGKILGFARPERLDGGFDLISRAGTAWRAGSRRPVHPVFEERRAIRLAPATATLYRRALFDRIGFFEESFESYLEDVELGLRCAAAGLGGAYVPEALCRHHGGASSGAWSAEVVRRMARNQVWLVRRHFPAGNGRAIFAGQLLWGLVALRHGRGVAWLRGKWEGMRGTAPRGTPVAQSFLLENESEIRRLQTLTGFDSYWRWYFRLAGRSGAN